MIGLRPATLLKKDSGYRWFLVNFAKFLGGQFKEHLWATASAVNPLVPEHFPEMIKTGEYIYQLKTFIESVSEVIKIPF